jgi:hypothetical protein
MKLSVLMSGYVTMTEVPSPCLYQNLFLPICLVMECNNSCVFEIKKIDVHVHELMDTGCLLY